ncbi:hypothetical protein SAMN05216188_11893 [Lentzea xinjiangensis]|uniref:Uncharacterized protein n=1 Tax=Lentzea xinjiangensis TaxID=402600 RepID=A0A1H9TFJ9_9PSEU|nr:hypothetical protein [Lentzea xinjiangensis]SER95982.1 hypothetical protein SAMN05216188_11893 [Lentzea xinjiangensis]
MISPADMPRKRPVHPYRPPLAKRTPEWHCRKKSYPTREAADDSLGELWQRRRGGPIEAHAYQCRRHGNREVWHLTRQDQEGRA